MIKNQVSVILKIFFIILLSVQILFAIDDKRVADELDSPMPEIPLKQAMGDKAYGDAISSGKYSFVGNTKCRLCHREFFLGRKQDPHDHAMNSLTKSANEKNSHCLMCHSTGHGMESGFIDMEKTPRLSNVQCEGCHGPGNVHIELAKDKNKKKRFTSGGFLAGADNPEILKKMCASCHTERWNKSYSYHDFEKAYNSYKKADPNSRYK